MSDELKARVLALLARLGTDAVGPRRYCYVCAGLERNGVHQPDCELAAVIRELER